MFEIWETNTPARKLGDAATFDEALDLLDAACETRHRDAVANGEGVSTMRFYFEIRDETHTAAMLAWRPEPDRPFSSVAATMRQFGEPG